MWEEMVECCSAAGRTGEVEEVVRRRLEQGQATPILLCVLGDVTVDPENYLKAWKMSGGKCGRAQRSLGFYHLRRKEVRNTVCMYLQWQKQLQVITGNLCSNVASMIQLYMYSGTSK